MGTKHEHEYARPTTNARWGFQGRDNSYAGQPWTFAAVGLQDVTNTFATRDEAEAEMPRLAIALECPESDLRVCLLELGVE